jgi:hypothetical protein
VALTEKEKLVGRQFRDDCNAWLGEFNRTNPPTFDSPHFIGVFRHLCPARDGRSLAIELKEQYLFSPIYEEQEVPAGRFGFLYREGRCRACGQDARSHRGRVVDAWERPPLKGHVRS